MDEATTSAGRGRPQLAMLVGIAVAAFALHAAFYAGYGWFRDELYFLACSEHLDWGYVDAPPGVPLLLSVARQVFGDTLFGARFFPMLFAAFQVLLAGLTAHAMGGGRYAQALAALGVMVAPFWFPSYLNTDMFMDLGWAACAWLAARVLAGESPRLWLAFGAAAGLAFEGKHSIVFFLFAFVTGLLLTPERRFLADRRFWAGAALALLLALPNVAWQIAHSWPTLELLTNIARSSKNVERGPLAYLLANVAYLSPVTLPLWGSGLAWCGFARAGRRFRAFGLAWLIAFVLFVALKGKPYYFTPMFSTLFAAGAVALEAWIARRREPGRGAWQVGVGATVLLGCAMLWPLAMPVLPVERFLAYQHALHVAPPVTETQPLGALPQQYADMFGWPELADAVAKAYRSLPPAEHAACGIFALNYGEAAAIDHFGKALGLPPALSGHQNYWLWGPRGYDGRCLVVVGGRRAVLERAFDEVVQVGESDHPYAVPAERHLPIWVVHGLKPGSLQAMWPSLKHWM
jgi:4-amino-4-deoxy-L-arabinose transferase-like glycosyltransferase